MQLTFANFLAPDMNGVYAFVVARLGSALGVETRFVSVASHAQLVGGEIDVAFICGLPYVRLASLPAGPVRAVAAPVIDDPRSGERPTYYSDVVVRAASPARSFADLRGRSFAHTRRDSFSGYVATCHRLAEMGETEAFFGEVRYSGMHQASIRQVCEGTVEAAAIDSHVLAVERRRNPSLAIELRVVAAIGPAPYPPVVVGPRVAPELAARLTAALCRLGEASEREPLDDGLIRRYVPVDDATYDDIRRKAAAVAAAGVASA